MEPPLPPAAANAPPPAPAPAPAAALSSSAPLPSPPHAALLMLGTLYGGMACIAGVLGAKQVALGPLAVEAGIFPFLLLVAISSTVATLFGRGAADLLVRLGFIPLLGAIALTLIVLRLPADPGMDPGARTAFPIILGQSWRLMAAGIIAYGVSMSLNVLLFSRLRTGRSDRLLVRGAVASMISQIIDTVLFITIAFYGVRPIGQLLLGQALAKAVLSVLLVPVLIAVLLRVARMRLWHGANDLAGGAKGIASGAGRT